MEIWSQVVNPVDIICEHFILGGVIFYCCVSCMAQNRIELLTRGDFPRYFCEISIAIIYIQICLQHKNNMIFWHLAVGILVRRKARVKITDASRGQKSLVG